MCTIFILTSFLIEQVSKIVLSITFTEICVLLENETRPKVTRKAMKSKVREIFFQRGLMSGMRLSIHLK